MVGITGGFRRHVARAIQQQLTAGEATVSAGTLEQRQGRSQPARLSFGNRRRSFGKGLSLRKMPSAGSRPGRRDGEGPMAPLALIGWILMTPGHSRSIGPAVCPCLQKNDQHLSGSEKSPR